MNPPKFQAGQAVVCIHDFGWRQADGEQPLNEQTPTSGRIYVIKDMVRFGPVNEWMVNLAEIRDLAFSEDGFAPVELASDEAIAELLEESFHPVTA